VLKRDVKLQSTNQLTAVRLFELPALESGTLSSGFYPGSGSQYSFRRRVVRTICSLDTSVCSTLAVLDDNALFKYPFVLTYLRGTEDIEDGAKQRSRR